MSVPDACNSEDVMLWLQKYTLKRVHVYSVKRSALWVAEGSRWYVQWQREMMTDLWETPRAQSASTGRHAVLPLVLLPDAGATRLLVFTSFTHMHIYSKILCFFYQLYSVLLQCANTSAFPQKKTVFVQCTCGTNTCNVTLLIINIGQKVKSIKIHFELLLSSIIWTFTKRAKYKFSDLIYF